MGGVVPFSCEAGSTFDGPPLEAAAEAAAVEEALSI